MCFFYTFTGFNCFKVKKFMKENIRKLLADFSWVFAIFVVLIFVVVLDYFNIDLSSDKLGILWATFISLFLCLGYKLTLTKLLFPKNASMKWGLLVVSASIIALMQCGSEALEFILRFDNITTYFRNNEFTMGNMFVKTHSIIFIIATIFIAPFAEEFFFRYHYYATMKVRYESIPIAMIISSLIFAMLHIVNRYSTAGIVGIFFHGIIFAHIFEKTGSILFSIILHALNNALAILKSTLLFAYEATFSMIVACISLLILLISLVVFLWRKLFRRKPEYVEVGGVIDAPFIPQVTTTIDEVLTERCGSGQVDDAVDGTPNPPQVKTELDTQK